MNVVLVVVDSLRADHVQGILADTPWLDSRHDHGWVQFDRAFSTECWTLPSHMSMFTGHMPSVHGAHFQHMGYAGSRPTIAEELGKAGYRTHAITRNTVFDGTLLGATRGFRSVDRPVRGLDPWSATGIFTALAKPRVQKMMQETGFFSPFQKSSRDFLTRLMRLGIPADEEALSLALHAMQRYRRSGQPYFMFLNLYDVHLPYPPVADASQPPPTSVESLEEIAAAVLYLPQVAAHKYLEADFEVPKWAEEALRRRYRKAVELMDQKLSGWMMRLEGAGLTDNTLFILTSDHGEAFGEHGLWGHDASAYNVHTHVPLLVRYPNSKGSVTRDTVSLRDLAGLMRTSIHGDFRGTILDWLWRGEHQLALSEHTPYRIKAPVLKPYRTLRAAVQVGAYGKLMAIGHKLLLYPSGDETTEPITISEPEALELLRGHAGRAQVNEAMACLRRATHADQA